jgi:Flp pilus assembly protein TadG
MTNIVRERGPRERGQALVEMGVVVFLFVLLTMGVIEFGRLLMVVNVLTHAARDGARAAAVIPLDERGGAGGCAFAGAAATDIENRVRTQIRDVTDDAGFNVAVSPACIDNVPVVQVEVSGDLGLIFNIIGNVIPIDRTVAFRDESCPPC